MNRRVLLRLLSVITLGAATCFAIVPARGADTSDSSDSNVLSRCQLSMVKVYGVGGIAGLEEYQSGVFLTGAPTRVLSIDSAVLEEGSVTLVDAHGERCQGQVVGRDGPTGLVLIECPKAFSPPATIDRDDITEPRIGQRVWILSNAFSIATGDEPVTVQRGRLSTFAPMPTSGVNAGAGYRPTIGTPTAGTPVLLLDAITSNPGTGGGVVFADDGAVLGIVGAECRSPNTGAWINYALPAKTAFQAAQRIVERAGETRREPSVNGGRRVREAMRGVGLRMIPAITRRAPAYVEYVLTNGPADRAGCLPDDLIVAVAGVTVGSVDAAQAAITRELERSDRIELTVLRENQLVSLRIEGTAP